MVKWSDYKSKVNEFKKTCGPLESCLSSLAHCDIFGDNKTGFILDVTKTYCGLVLHVSESSCYDKLEESTCFKEWDGVIANQEDLDEREKKEACKNYFGKDGCLREEITRLCGRDKWIEYRDLMIKMNDLLFKHCDLRTIV
uniref:DUF19 domain-containing protein n=1 Tax=Caenorhabditis tropicalis TaxID=1561998 RepID=A0A1I7V298_9PELO